MPSQTRGVLVGDIKPGGVADQAGIRRGDYILAIGGQRIASADDVSRALADKAPGEEVMIEIWRDGASQQLNAKLQEASQEPGAPFARPGQQAQGGRRHTTMRPNFDEQDTTPWIGIWMEDEAKDQGIAVRHVFPSGPASRAGLRTGDVIVSIGDKKVAAPQELIDQIGSLKANETVEFSIMRGGQSMTVPVVIGQRGDYADVAMPEPEGNDRFAQQQGQGFDNDFDSVPDHSMMLEQHRRFAEQHERIENLILELKEEVRQLREELKTRDGKPAQQEAPSNP
jgi:predicted metalloprotease with PDZ domain